MRTVIARNRRQVWVLFAVIVIYASVVVANQYEHRIPWVAATARIVMFLSIAALLAYGALAMQAQKELERLIFFESSAIAFFATAASALVAAALDDLGIVGRPSPWTFWSVGWITFCIARVILVRRRT